MRIDELRATIRQANDDYVEGRSGLSDKEYDDLMDELRALSPKDPLLEAVGAVPKTRMEPIPLDMFSLEKFKTMEEVYDWASNHNIPMDTVLCASLKLDGISLCVDEEDESAWTRGDGKIGQRSDGHYKFVNRGNRGNCQSRIYTFGEAIMSKQKFLKYPQFSTARNMVSGQISGDKVKPDTLVDIDYIRYGMVPKEGSNLKSQSFVMSQLNCMNPYPMPFTTVLLRELTEAMIIEWFNQWSKEYHGDGIVIQVDDLKLASRLGRRSNGNPEYAFAYKGKFAEDIVPTSVDHLEWNVSKRAYLKPVGVIDPVILNGAETTRVNLYNYKNVMTGGIGAGSVIKMRRSGVVIPKVEEIVQSNFDISVDIPECCPSCGGELDVNDTGVELICTNGKDCSGVKLAKIVSFFSTAGVEDFGYGIIKKFFDGGEDTVSKILNMTVSDMEKYEGFAEKKALNVHTAIHSKMTELSLSRLQHASCCFEDIGEDTFEKINRIVTDYHQSTKSEMSLRMVIEDKLGKSVSENYVRGASAFTQFRKEIAKHIAIKELKIESDKMKGWVVVFTGFRSEIMENKIKANGGMVGNSITKSTTHLVMKEKGSGTVKEQKAVKQGVQIFSMDEFNSLT